MNKGYLAGLCVLFFIVCSMSVSAVSATCSGTSYTSGSYQICVFKSTGTYNITGSGNVEVLVVAGGGGGGGGNYVGGGGGAGGLLYNASYPVVSGEVYNITVGAGGAKSTISGVGRNGSSSRFGLMNATGGGGGGILTNNVAGQNGGSGGGGHGAGSNNQGGTGIVGQGNNGGLAYNNRNGAGGGGGAGAVGQDGSSTNDNAGNGGNGLNYSINGTNQYYAGGGGGGSMGATAGLGGLGGGGNGSVGDGYDGIANTGGGGGGAERVGTGLGGAGGSGIVIVRYVPTTYSVRGIISLSGVVFPNATVVLLTNTSCIAYTTTNSTGGYNFSGVSNGVQYSVFAQFFNSTVKYTATGFVNATMTAD